MPSTARPRAPFRRKTRPQRRKGVRTLGIVLPSIAGVVALAIATQAALHAAEAKSRANAASNAPLRMDKPRFTGAMRDGREFLIVAKSAIRDRDDANKVALEGPELTRGYGTQEATYVVAQQGVYDESKSALLLTGDVQIESGDGYAFKTDKAVIDTRTGQVVGDQGVQGAGASGDSVRADSYSVSDKGDRVVFKGRVRTRLTPRQ